jgi:signal peptidase II
VVQDQLTKWLIVFGLEKGEVVPLLPGFNLTHVYNPGAAWSFLANAGGWQRWFFSAIALVVSVVLVAWLRTVPKHDWWLAMAIALVGRIVQGKCTY